MAEKNEKNEKVEEKKDEVQPVGTAKVMGNGLDFNAETETVILADVDPADGSEATKKALKKDDVLDGTEADQLPPRPVEKSVADATVARRAWEQRQGELAAVPDPDRT